MASGVLVPISSVYPSGADFATALAAITVPAPGRFSTTKDLPKRSVSFGARMRATQGGSRAMTARASWPSPHPWAGVGGLQTLSTPETLGVYAGQHLRDTGGRRHALHRCVQSFLSAQVL